MQINDIKFKSKFIQETPPPGHALFSGFLIQVKFLKMFFQPFASVLRSSNHERHFIYYGFHKCLTTSNPYFDHALFYDGKIFKTMTLPDTWTYHVQVHMVFSFYTMWNSVSIMWHTDWSCPFYRPPSLLHPTHRPPAVSQPGLKMFDDHFILDYPWWLQKEANFPRTLLKRELIMRAY